MQCNYIGKIDTEELKECMAGPSYYEPNEDEKNSYCIGYNFLDCPRFKATQLTDISKQATQANNINKPNEPMEALDLSKMYKTRKRN